MKRSIIITIFFIILSSTTLSQEPQISFVLNDPIPSSETKDYQARDFIKMNPGFLAEPDNLNFVQATIDPFMVFPPENGVNGGPDPNDDGVVGVLNGQINITELGAATYAIPIDISPGINNMQPNLSIVYNSFSGNGTMGIGWSIGGISAIHRIGKTYYHNNEIDGVDLMNDLYMYNDDQFALDGQRLICISGEHGEDGSGYRTEFESFTDIYAHGSINGEYGPESFTAFTKNGIFMEFGGTENSRIEAKGLSTGIVYTWNINKIWDVKGNYIDFVYSEDAQTGEYYILRIEYTGNDVNNQSPFCSVEFVYSDTRTDNNTLYLSGSKIGLGKRLDDIYCKYSQDTYRHYEFHYFENLYTHLSNIFVYDGNGDHFNGTDVIWNPITTEFSTQESIIEHTNAYNYNYGDFNGDGKTDYVRSSNNYPIQADDKWELFLCNNDQSFTMVNYGYLLDLSYKHYTYCLQDAGTGNFINMKHDFNGDGMDDLIWGTIYEEPNICNGQDFMYYYYVLVSTGDGFQQDFTTFEDFSSCSPIIHMYPGDYNGDGKTDLIYYGNESGWQLQLAQYPHETIDIQAGFSTSDKIIVGDFNGDGKDDVLLASTVDNTNIFEYDVQLENFIPINDELMGYPTKWHEIKTGDFNGDGNQDILTWTDYDNIGWELYYSNGKEFLMGNEPGLLNNDPSSVTYNCFVADYNGDGKADILETFPASQKLTNTYTFNVFYSKGYIFDNEYNTFYDHHLNLTEYSMHFGDFNGDGKNDCMYRPYWAGVDTTHIMNFHKDEKSNLINSINDGYNSQTLLEFKPITDQSIYTKGEDSEYPVIDLQAPIYVVSEMSADNGLNMISTSYNYENALFHRRGKSFLGFEKVTSQNNSLHLKIVTDYVLNENYYFLHPNTNNTYETSTTEEWLLTQTKTDIEINDFGSTRIFLYNNKTQTNNYRIDQTSDEYVNTQRVYNVYSPNDVIHGNLTMRKIYNDKDNLSFDDPDSNFDYRTVEEYTYNKHDIPETNFSLWQMNSIITSKESPEPDDIDVNIIEYQYFPYVHKHYPLLMKETNVPNSDITYTIEFEYDYDDFGNLTDKTIKAPFFVPVVQERKSEYFYEDGNHRFATKQEKLINSTEHIVENEYCPKSGNVIKNTDINGLITEYSYDGFGRMNKTILPDGQEIHQVFRWADGHEDAPCHALFYSWICKSGESESLIFYDRRGRELRTVNWNFNDTRKIYKDTEYKEVTGNVGLTTTPYFSDNNDKLITTYQYNNVGKVIQIATPVTTITKDYSGREVTSTNNGTSLTTIKKVNALGLLEQAEDPGGKIDYDYYSSGNIKEIIYNEENPSIATVTDLTFDAAGNQKTLDDPAAGLMTYTYNPFGELISQTDEKGNTFEMDYDELGRILTKTNLVSGEVYQYDYDTRPNGIGKPGSVYRNSILLEQYNYDEYSRPVLTTKIIDNICYNTAYTYGIYGYIKNITYPSGFSVDNHYSNGVLINVKQGDNDNLIWTLNDVSIHGKISQFTMGNGLNTMIGISDLGYTESIACGNIQDLEYDFDIIRGNLNYRKDNTFSLHEEFTYDNVFQTQLESWQVQNKPYYSCNYEVNGNILQKSDIGVYIYDEPSTPTGGKYAVEKIESPTPEFFQELSVQELDFFENNKVKNITDQSQGLSINFTYDQNDSREKTERFHNNSLIQTKLFINGLYEVEIDEQENERKIHYINGGNGVCAIYVEESSESNLYYIHKDYLGSIYAITDETGNIVQHENTDQVYSFDPWGRRRNATDWTYDNIPSSFLFDRGFTGHEHLDGFSLINMNARFYDPKLGRFLSPDNYVQEASSTGSLNRYTYCLNNPLVYTDPDGEFVHLVIGAVIGGTINWMTHGAEFTWDGAKYFGIGAAAGVLGAGIGAGIGAAYTGGSFGAGFIGTASVTTSSLGVAGGFASGFGGGFSSGLISGTGNSLMAGNNFKQSIKAGLGEGLTQGLIGGGIGGIVGGISAYSSGNHPFTGKPPHYEANLQGFSLVSQNDPMNCKNATLESIEKMNGGTKTQIDFKRLGDAFLKENPNATLEEYFEYFGYRIENPQGWSYNQIGRGMELGNPTVINENIGGGHTLTITKIRQWTPNSNVKVWFGDPTRGMWKANWNILGDPGFNNGAYLFWLH